MHFLALNHRTFGVIVAAELVKLYYKAAKSALGFDVIISSFMCRLPTGFWGLVVGCTRLSELQTFGLGKQLPHISQRHAKSVCIRDAHRGLLEARRCQKLCKRGRGAARAEVSAVAVAPRFLSFFRTTGSLTNVLLKVMHRWASIHFCIFFW